MKKLLLAALCLVLLPGCNQVIKESYTQTYSVEYRVTGISLASFGFYDSYNKYRLLYDECLPFSFYFTTTDPNKYLGMIVYSPSGETTGQIIVNGKAITSKTVTKNASTFQIGCDAQGNEFLMN